jgi:phosphoribosylanthranilate isomerase
MKKTFIKICGITNSFDALNAFEKGADAIGFMQTKESSRFVPLYDLRSILKDIGINKLTIPVFVNPNEEDVYKFLDIFPNSIIQFHGEEEENFCLKFNKPFIKAINFSDKSDLINKLENYKKAYAVLIDSGDSINRGGTGETFDWKLIPKDLSQKIIIAGGLNLNNIDELFEYFTPYGVDVSSGVESQKGVKDSLKVEQFINQIKTYE